MEETAAATNGGGYTLPDAYPGFKPPESLTLPSGAVFLVRRPQIVKMMRKGQIPNPLMGVVEQVFGERDERDLAAEAELKGLTVEQLLEQRQAEREAKADDPDATPPIPSDPDEISVDVAVSFMDVIVWAAIVAPKIEMEPMVGDSPMTASGALSYDALSDADIQAILAWVNSGDDTGAATFPADGERPAAGSDGVGVRDPAEHVAGHPA